MQTPPRVPRNAVNPPPAPPRPAPAAPRVAPPAQGQAVARALFPNNSPPGGGPPEGGRRRTARIGKLHEGDLTSLGYKRTAKASSRRRALTRAMKRYGSLSTYRKLNAVATYTKRTSPAASKVFKADRDWVGKQRA